MPHLSRTSSLAIVIVAVAIAGGIGVARYRHMASEAPTDPPAATGPKIRVPLWIAPEAVRHESRFTFAWDGPVPLESFRAAEGLDAVVEGAASDEERARRLRHWTRSQFEPGSPSPYPPPDAATTLSEIRAGRTQGFCAQYAFVLVQALQSFGIPARIVTIADHEVVEAWLRDEGRWTALDPELDLQVVGADGRSLSALQIHDGARRGDELRVTDGARLEEPLATYLGKYRRIAPWIRNTFTGAPMNFVDFDRYRAWIVDEDGPDLPPDALRTSHPEELYGPPATFPVPAVH